MGDHHEGNAALLELSPMPLRWLRAEQGSDLVSLPDACPDDYSVGFRVVTPGLMSGTWPTQWTPNTAKRDGWQLDPDNVLTTPSRPGDGIVLAKTLEGAAQLDHETPAHVVVPVFYRPERGPKGVLGEDANLVRVGGVIHVGWPIDLLALLRDVGARNANLTRANFRHANLVTMNGYGASLRSARLTSANLAGAMLNNADLTAADFRFANLSHATLARADLYAATFNGADLRGTDLQSAYLSETPMCGALFDRNTVWPHDDFDPEREGAIEVPIANAP